MKTLAIIIAVSLTGSTTFAFSGHITSNTTWTSDIIVTGDVWIDAGVTLTIMPGVTVMFPKVDQNGDGIGDTTFIILGQLHCQGQAENKVTFTSMELDYQPGDWRGILYETPESGSLSTLSNTEILYACEALHINGRNLTLDSCHIAYAADYGVRIQTTLYTTSFNSCLIERCGGHGVKFESGTCTMFNTTVSNNDGFGVKVDAGASLTATGSISSTNAYGGILADGCSPTIDNCIFTNNTGSGMFLDNGAAPAITRSDFTANTVGVFIAGSSQPQISYCHIAGNEISGVVACDGSQPVINHSNIFGNRYGALLHEVPDNLLFSYGAEAPGEPSAEYYAFPVVENLSELHIIGYVNAFLYNGGFSFEVNSVAHLLIWPGFQAYNFDFWSNALVSSEDGQIHTLTLISGNAGGYGGIIEIRAIDGELTQLSTNNDSGVVIDANYNWWGQTTDVDNLVYQLNPGTVSYQSYLNSEVVNAGATLPSHPIELPYLEDFEDGIANSFEVVSGTWSVVDGVYRCYNNQPSSKHITTVGETTWSDYRFECDIRVTGAPEQEFLFRYQSPGDWYLFGVMPSPDNIAFLWKSVGGYQQLLALVEDVPNAPNQWRHLAVEVEGSTIRGYFDGTQVLSYVDNNQPFLTGKVALDAFADPWWGWQEVYIDNVSVSAIGTATAVPNSVFAQSTLESYPNLCLPIIPSGERTRWYQGHHVDRRRLETADWAWQMDSPPGRSASKRLVCRTAVDPGRPLPTHLVAKRGHVA